MTGPGFSGGSATRDVNWHEANQRYLMSSVGLVKATLKYHAQQVLSSRERALVRCFGRWLPTQGTLPPGSGEPATEIQRARQAAQVAAVHLSAPSSLDWLSTVLDLSPFERDILLMCAGVELDSTFRSYCLAAQEDGRRIGPTFSLALAAFPGAHWSALNPERPLRHHHLINMGEGEALTVKPLRIDEGVLHYLTGIPCLDTSLLGVVRPVMVAGEPVQVDALLISMEDLWSQHSCARGAYPVIQLCGEESFDKRAVSAFACARFGLPLYSVHVEDLPATADREALARVWTREALLRDCVLLVQCEGSETTEQIHAVLAFIDRAPGRIIVIGPRPLPLRNRAWCRLQVDRLEDEAEEKVADELRD